MQFTAGEPIEGYRQVGWNNPRCGSVFTAKIEGRSLYGRIKRFVRITCRRSGVLSELALVQWFAAPEYPDGDKLLVRIDTHKPPVPVPSFLQLDEIDPDRIMYEMDPLFMYMMRVQGLDIGL